MVRAALIFVILACAYCANGIPPEIKATVEECKNEHNIDSSQIKDSVEQKKIPETENGKCFLSCVMNKLGFLNDGKVDLQKTMEMNKKKFTDPENLEKANKIAKMCSEVKAPDGNPCSLAVEVTKCAMQKAFELKLQVPWKDV